MDCDTCGRHRPSDQVTPFRDPMRGLVMACGRCRRLAAHWPRASRHGGVEDPAAKPPASPATP
jgi:hypothetical protein